MKIKFTVEFDCDKPCDCMSPEDVADVTAQLNDIAGRLKAIAGPVPNPRFARTGVSRMATPASITQAISDINTATNQLAAVVTDLRSKVGVGMSQADVDDVDAQLASIATQLTGIAADPNNPVPPAPAPQNKRSTKP